MNDKGPLYEMKLTILDGLLDSSPLAFEQVVNPKSQSPAPWHLVDLLAGEAEMKRLDGAILNSWLKLLEDATR